MAPDRIECVAFDAKRGESLEAAFAGIDVLCLITPLSDEASEWQQAVFKAAKNVRRIVMVSVDAASPSAKAGPGALHWRGEEMLQEMTVERAILRPTMFMQHFLIVPGVHVAGDDVFYLPFGNSGAALLDCRDISALAAVLANVDEASLPHEPVAMTGPEALTGAEMARILTAACGRPIRWEASRDAFLEHSASTGSPTELAAIYDAGANGAFATVERDGFEKFTGRSPSSFAKFASDHADVFRSR